MATPFSWSDTLKITIGTCLPCIKPKVGAGDSGDDEPNNQNNNGTISRIPRARPDELQGLLADPETDPEAETMSLHSNPGRSKRKKKRSSKNNHSRTSLKLFGYNLFGSQPIQLPDDGEDALYQDDWRRRRRERNESLSAPSIATAHSTASTFDLDAAPLDAETINALSSPSAVEAAAQAAAEAEAQRLREKEERRRKRREKKELRRLAEALTAQNVDGDDFEGFQGSGSGVPSLPKASPGHPRIPNAMYPGGPTSDSGSGSGFSGSVTDGFGRFISAPNGAPLHLPHNDEDEEAADLDGGVYSRNQARDAVALGSDSRSRTSASASDRPHAHQYPGDQPPRNNVLANLRSRSRSHSHSHASSSRVSSPLQAHFEQAPETEATSSPSGSTVAIKKRRKNRTSTTASSRTPQSRSSATTSQSHSPSISSPISPNFTKEIVSPSTIEQGQGFFDLEDEDVSPQPQPPPEVDVDKPGSGFPSTRIGGGGGFPMTGFGSATAGQRRTAKDFGAFLARRGEDDADADVGL
ncbi:hypothetical protein JR316_0009556 [Psilocybe cubensis]|uniref:Uncharacterized protein n=2 Tax=Psilocybe cubensis TaxID=181762 RepID=A0ACB8GQQ8_PSICU|nr:hypothetical protein JR316_0009556 [Psilocybe cubensis]KAH9477350.1 hypothetical protein JR316_0009556 [Psilocybe cubensis]